MLMSKLLQITQDIGELLINLTKSMAHAPYYEATNELHCIKKLRTKLINEQNIVQETWFRQTQTIS